MLISQSEQTQYKKAIEVYTKLLIVFASENKMREFIFVLLIKIIKVSLDHQHEYYRNIRGGRLHLTHHKSTFP